VEVVQATCQYTGSQVLLTLQPNFENLKWCVVLMMLLWILPALMSCTSILNHLKEDVIKIQQQNTFPNLKNDQEHIAGLQVKLNALVSIFYKYQLFFVTTFI